MLSYSLLGVVHVSGSPEISNWFEKTVFNPSKAQWSLCRQIQIGVCANAFSFGAKLMISALERVLITFFQIKSSWDLNYTRHAVWSHFIVYGVVFLRHMSP